jgi:hypothetical protein
MLTMSIAARDARRLGKSIFKTDFLGRGPAPSSAGPQPENTGIHYRQNVPFILQFPSEILCTIFTYIEPIWLFQLEEAHPDLRELLASPCCNKIWYDLLPAALMSEPECFQDEMEIVKILNEGRNDGVVLPDLSDYILKYD